MAVQLLKTPNKVNLAGNPITVQIGNPDGIIKTQGVKGLYHFGLTGLNAQENDSFDMVFGTTLLTFTFMEIIDDSTLQLPLATGLTLGEYILLLHTIFLSNYYITKYYDLSMNGNEINFQAKYVGSDYALELENELGNNVTLTTTFNASDTIYKEDYQLLLQVYVLIDGVKTLISEDLTNTDTEGNVSLDVAELLKPYFKSEFIWPERPGLDLLTHRPDATVAFQFVIAEKFDGIIRGLTPIEDIFYAINGGVISEDLKFYKTYDTNYYDFSTNKERWLTWCPDNKIISKTQPERLFFFTGEVLSLYVSCKIYYTDGTDYTFNFIEATDVQAWAVYEIITGYSILELEQINLIKEILKYEIFPTVASTTIVYNEVVDVKTLNTAWDGNEGMLPVGSLDSRWFVLLSNAAGTYNTSDMQLAHVSTPDPSWVVSPFLNATWISLYANSFHSGSKDFMFFSFLTVVGIDPVDFDLNLHFFADNSVHEIFVNDYPQSPHHPDKLPQSPVNPYGYYGFNSQGVQVSLHLTHDWQLGQNVIRVWVKSSAPKMGFLCQGLSASIRTEGEPDIVHTYDRIFEKRTYHLDNTFHQNEKCFIFKNSFDKWDTVRCTGEQISKVDIDRQSVNVLAELIGSENKDVLIEYEQTFKANSGWTDHLCKDPKAYMNYLREFLRSTEIYEVKGDFLVPVKLLSKKVQLHTSRVYVYNLAFEYMYASKEEFFSSEVGIENIKFLMDDQGNPITDDNETPLFN